jgi:hypothetical protein
MEELTDARLRCEQLKRYIQDAVQLVEKSPQRDHIFEVAGHLLHGIPEALFKLDKALGATALAATKLDYDEIKQTLKPEKVEELERALEDSRIRYVTRRSGDTPMQPNETAKALRDVAAGLAESGRFPVKDVASIVAMLREQEVPNLRLASIPTRLDPNMILAVADAITDGTLRNRERLAVVLETALQQALGGQQMQALLQSAGSREEVMDGFKKENPALTDAQLKEIADQWEANKDVVKNKTARKGDGDPIWDVRGGVQIALDDAYKFEKIDKSNWPPRVLKLLQQAFKLLNQANDAFIQAAKEMDGSPAKFANEEVLAGAGEEFQKVNPAITDEQVAIINDMHEKHKDVVKNKHAGDILSDFSTALIDLSTSMKAASEDIETKAAHVWKIWRQVEGPQGGGVKQEMKRLAPEVLDIVSSLRKQVKVISGLHTMAWRHVTAAESDHESKFEKGKPADPTENMTPEQKAEWERQNKEHKDQFKSATRTVPLEDAKKGDMVEVEIGVPWPNDAKKEKVTGKVVRVKADGLVTVDVEKTRTNPGGHPNEDVSHVDVRPKKKSASDFKDASSNFPDWPTPTGVSPEEWANALRVYVEVTDFLKPAWNAGTENPDRRGVPQMDVNIFVDWLHDMREQGAPAAEYVAQTIRIETLLKSLIEKLDKDYAKHRDDILMYIDTHGVAGKDAFRDLLFGQDTYGDVLRRMRHERLITLDPAIQGYVRV